jgi:Na+-translocating ferredoxin:NAD+ oxidoreductase RnfD subunit
MFRQNLIKQLSVGALLGLFYFLLQLLIRPEPYTSLVYEAGKLFKSIGIGIAIYLILYFLKSKK